MIFLTFKDVKQRSWDICQSKIQSLVGEEYSRHRYLLDSEILDSEERTYFENVIFRRCNLDELERSLRVLCAYLTRFHGEKVFVLIDEYDSPIHESYLQGYYNEVISFFS